MTGGFSPEQNPEQPNRALFVTSPQLSEQKSEQEKWGCSDSAKTLGFLRLSAPTKSEQNPNSLVRTAFWLPEQQNSIFRYCSVRSPFSPFCSILIFNPEEDLFI